MQTCEIQRETVPYSHKFVTLVEYIYFCPLSEAHLICTPFREFDLLPSSGGLCNDEWFFMLKITGDDWCRRQLSRLVVRVKGQY